MSQKHDSTVVETRGIAIPEYWRNLSVTIPDFQTSALATVVCFLKPVFMKYASFRDTCPVFFVFLSCISGHKFSCVFRMAVDYNVES